MRGPDFARQLQSLERYRRNSDWGSYLALAASPEFQHDLAIWTARKGEADATGPLGVLEFALEQAVRLQRIGDAATFTLATARWARRLSIRTTLGATGSGAPGTPHGPKAGQESGKSYGSGEADVRTGPDVLRTLLRAWELFDDGNPGAGRSLLAAIVRGSPALIRTSDGARWAVPLLREALVIDPDAAVHLLRLVDDNVLGDLARELTSAGEYAHARVAGAAMRLFYETKADVLADLALAQAEAASKQQTAAEAPPGEPAEPADLRAVTETANLAADAALRARQEGEGSAARLAKVAAALTLVGADDQAAQRWAEAMAAAKQEPKPNQVLADFAKAQIRADLIDDAAQVIEVLLNQAQPDVGDWQVSAALDPAWQAAAALVTALAERGDVDRAGAVLRMIPDFAHCYPRAVRALARAIAATDLSEAERLAGQVRNPGGRGYVLAAVSAAALSAGHQRDAARVAGGIEHPLWRAQALVDLAVAPGQAADIPFGEVRGAIAAVTDDEDKAVLLARYAVTRDNGERRRLLAEARRLAGQAPADARWRALANIGATVAEAGLVADARKQFTAAQRPLANDPREWELELYQLCRVRFNTSDTVGARETAAIALGVLPGRRAAGRRAGRPPQQRTSASPTALDSAIAAAEIAAEIPMAVAALAAIGCAIPPGPAEPGREEEPGVSLIEWVLAEAERLATDLRGAGAIAADESLTRAYTALGDLTAAERKVLSLLPPPDPGTEQNASRQSAANDEGAGGESDADPMEGMKLITVARERGVALSDSLVAAGESERAATFMREVAGRLAPCAWGMGPAAPDLLAELAGAQVRAGDNEGARTTAGFAATVAQGMTGAFSLSEPFGPPVDDWTDTVITVVDAMAALIREAEVKPPDFAKAAQPAIEYARRPWQARARTLAALAQACADPAERGRLATLLTAEQEQIWQLATVTFVRGVTLDPGDAVEALAVLAGAQAANGELANARRAIARARELAADIEDPGDRARALAGVVRGLSAIGDHMAAVSVACSIGHLAYEGQAMADAITAAANASLAADNTDLIARARAIRDKGWRAIALVAVAVAGTGPLNFAEANELISEVAHGDPRTRVWQEVIGRCVAAGRYDQAADLAAGITADAGAYLAVIAAELGLSSTGDSGGATPRDHEAARAALLRLLPRCVHYPEAAYAACTALATASPADAALIARAVAQHAAAVTAVTAPRSTR